MSRNGFVMVLVDSASGTVKTSAVFKRKPAISNSRLDSQCPLFGDGIEAKTFRIIRSAPPPVVWINDRGEVCDIFHRAPWPLHIHDPKSGIWATEFLDPSPPDGKLHLRLVRPLRTDREMVQVAWRLPENGAQPFAGEEAEYHRFYEKIRDISAKNIPRSEKIQRKDLREKTVFTIDNDDSRDLDDALDVFWVGEDHYIVGIHIADVAAFVKPDSNRDKDAQRRGTSHYFDDTVLHMLPHCLSTDLCSLSPGREKLAVSIYFDMVMDHGKAVIKGSRIFDSVIRSCHQLTYSEADKALAGETTNIPDDVLQTLRHTVSIGHSLRAGRPDNLSEPNDHGVSGAMIEDFMVTANQLVGEQMAKTLGTLKNARKRVLFRSHPGPSVKDLMTLAARLAAIDLMAPFDPQELLDAARSRRKKEFPSRSGKEAGAFLSAALHREIRSRLRVDSNESAFQLKALESGDLKIWKGAGLKDLFEFSGHHGLGISRYAWFTSPIRRYPDIVNHRFLKSAMGVEFSGKNLKKVNQEAMHRLIANGKAAQRAYRQRRDFHCLFETENEVPKEKISVTPLNFRWFGPYTFIVEAEMDGVKIQIQLRDPEHVHIEAHGLECRIAPVGQPVCMLRVGQPAWLRLRPASGDISPRAGRIFVKTSQWMIKI